MIFRNNIVVAPIVIKTEVMTLKRRSFDLLTVKA